MIGAERFILIGCLLQGALGSNWAVWMPQSIEALIGSCVLIPCRFEIPSEYDSNLSEIQASVNGKWKKDETIVFDSSSQSASSLQGKITGDLLQKNCTTVLENLTMNYHGHYKFRLECNNRLKYNFEQSVQINITDSPPKPKIPIKRVEVMEGTSVSLSCSAAAPCPKLPPNLTWTPRLNDSVEHLQENEDQTKFVSSVLTFTASHLHHGQKITCRALYTLQKRDTQRRSKASMILKVRYAPKNTSVSVSPSGSVLEGSSVTLTCSSNANPAVQNYTWYKVNGTEMNTVGTGQNLTFNVTESSGNERYYCEAQNEHGKEKSKTVQLALDYPPKNTSLSVSPSGSVLEGSSVTLTCSSNANPAVQNYTWYKVNGTEMNTVGTGQNLTFNVTESSGSEMYYCEAQNEHGKENSTTVQLNVIYMPQISGSGSCSRTAAEISCSCESRGNPSPSMEWRVSGLRVTNSTERVIREEQLGNTGLRSSLTMRQSQGDMPTLICISTNTLGSSSLQLHLPSPQQHSGFGIISLLIAAAAGAGATMMICLIMQHILKKKRHSQRSESRMKDSEGIILSDGTAAQDEESIYVNKTMLSGAGVVEKGDEGALHYATVDFSKLPGTGGEHGTGIVRGTSKRTPDYAIIRHKSREEREGGEEEGEEVQEEMRKEGQAELGTERESAEARGEKEEEPTEEATYGNICPSRPTKRARLGLQQPPGNPAAEEEQRQEENSAGGQEDMYVDVMSPLTEGNGKGTEESEYAEVRKPK
ncbi:B-cell receptor CD22-like [Anguilla rostrata]|uniref:B-cell receptor CD22-like n=1 Tax=Anguilla rostrata TaxID=7938 RepID=UPI0030D14C86